MAPPPVSPGSAFLGGEAVPSLFAQLAEVEREPTAPALGGIDWAALSAPARPLPPIFQATESGLFALSREASVAPPLKPTQLIPPSAAREEFALFSNMGPAREAPPLPPPSGSTLSRLKQVVHHPGHASLPAPVAAGGSHERQGMGGGGSLPAAAVTVPLGEVMRLIATGGPPVASPFDTFRAALRTPSPF
ncbi:MAG: hypothetical protein WCP77_06005 [Roseococcus sp.]